MSIVFLSFSKFSFHTYSHKFSGHFSSNYEWVEAHLRRPILAILGTVMCSKAVGFQGSALDPLEGLQHPPNPQLHLNLATPLQNPKSAPVLSASVLSGPVKPGGGRGGHGPPHFFS